MSQLVVAGVDQIPPEFGTSQLARREDGKYITDFVCVFFFQNSRVF